MATHSRASVLAIHEDSVFIARLAKVLEGDPRLAWFGGYSELAPSLVQRRRQPANVAIIGGRKRSRSDRANIDASPLTRRWPKMAMLVLAEDEEIEALFEAFDTGATGYLPREANMSVLLDAVRLVNEGYAVISRRMLRLLMEHNRSMRMTEQGWPKLRKSEIRILSQLSCGASQKEVAEALGVAYQTVRNMCQRIYRILGVNSQRSAVGKYLAGIRSRN